MAKPKAKNAAAREGYWNNRDRIRLQKRIQRRANVARAILLDTKRFDTRRKHEHDLDLAFVENLICDPCVYCGDRELRRTLDRIAAELWRRGSEDVERVAHDATGIAAPLSTA